MAILSETPPRSSRPRLTRPKSSFSNSDNSTPTNPLPKPAKKKRKYIPGGPGGGGRYIDEDGTEVPVGGTGPGGYNYIGPRGRTGRQNNSTGHERGAFNRRDRFTRTRKALPRSQSSSLRFSSAAQAAAVIQSDGYKPREERAWEEFHPNLDIDIPFRAFNFNEVDGENLGNAISLVSPQSGETHITAKTEESGQVDQKASSVPLGELIDITKLRIPGTPGGGKRRPGRPPKDPVAFFAARAAAKLGKGFHYIPQKTPNNKSLVPAAKEKLKLHQPSYRKSNTLARFENKALGHAKCIDKTMINVGYQESDIFIRPEKTLIKASDIYLEEDLDFGPGCKCDSEKIAPIGSSDLGRVEYDMDEQDDKWLDTYNVDRKAAGINIIQREVFEITITKIEKEWHNLEKRIPKPNPKPPQTHRPRSSSAAAVNGEALAGEEQDSKCAICDDGDCENTNAIVFCDGCDLAVHQHCYGVPFIPEGQWLCRKCQLIGRGVPTCIFCPNTDGAFKQTNASKWAHLLCAMWIPEVSIGNTSFMEPVMEVEKVPKTRWKLNCYLCNQRMGACIQCGNKSCYQAFHVTCARRSRLFLKMKNNQGTLSILDGNTNMKAFCDKHCPPEWAKKHDVAHATREARAYFKKTMRGRLWADSQASALEMAANHYHANSGHHLSESQLIGVKMESKMGHNMKKEAQIQKPDWKLPSGAPVIPFCVYEKIEKSLVRFNVEKHKDYTADVCRYWTLKREARRGAALLKRLQLQMEIFSSMEITRRNFPGMGPAGRPRLQRRIEFAKILMKDIENLKKLSEDVVKRETTKLDAARLQIDFVDTVYFPITMLLPPTIEQTLKLDSENILTKDIIKLQQKLKYRHFVSVVPFIEELCRIFRYHVDMETKPQLNGSNTVALKNSLQEIREFNKLTRKILSEVVQPQIEIAARAESEISGKPVDEILKDLSNIFESILQNQTKSISMRTSLLNKNSDASIVNYASNELCNSSSFNSQTKIMQSDYFDTKNINETISGSRREKAHSTVEARINNNLEDSIFVGLDTTNRNLYTDTHNKLDSFRETTHIPNSNNQCLPLNNQNPGRSTPPIQNEKNYLNQSNMLSNGGIPWVFKDFKVNGTTCLLVKDRCCYKNEISDDEPLSSQEDKNEVLNFEAPAVPHKDKPIRVKKKIRMRR